MISDTISRRLFQLAFVALALFIPFSIAGANIAVGIGLLAWALAALSARGRPAATGSRPSLLSDPILPASILLAASALPSVFVSENVHRAIGDWRSYWLLAIYFLVVAHLVAHRMREAAFWILFASTTISCLVAFIQRAGGLDAGFIHIGAKHRVESTLYTMTFAGILYQVIILNFTVALRGSRGSARRGAVLWAGVAIQFVAIILTVTRGAWVARFAGLATACLLIRNRLVLALSAAAVSIVLVFALVTGEDSDRYVSPLELSEKIDVHAGTRLVLWNIAWDLFKQHPVLGVGMGDYSIEADKLVGDRTVTTTTDTHNVYLQVLATRGLVGFVPFVIFWVVVLRSLARQARRSPPGSVERHYALAAIAVTVAVLFGALTENNIDDEEVFIAYMFILGLAMSARYAPAASGVTAPSASDEGEPPARR